MATTVLGVGLGVFIITLVWILTLVFAIIVLRGSRSTQLLVIPLLLLALFITVGLVFFPRRSETTSPVREKEIVDSFFIGRYVLLSIVSAVFLVALFMMLPLHFLEPVYAKPLRTH